VVLDGLRELLDRYRSRKEITSNFCFEPAFFRILDEMARIDWSRRYAQRELCAGRASRS
jgi:hypothetical protein